MKQNDYDTIFASSSQFKSAIKIIRISGKNAKKIPSIFNFKRPSPRTFVLRKLTYKNNIIDNAPVVWLPRKKNFTGEDTFEIYIHGSVVIEKLIFKILSSYKNFRLAKPGEFTKRATLNGNIDLIQAESINEIINTQTDKQLTIAQAQLDGSLSKVINSWRESIIYMFNSGIDNFVEIGPGKVLTGMVKRTLKDVNCFSINSITDIKNLKNEFKK